VANHSFGHALLAEALDLFAVPWQQWWHVQNKVHPRR
jgi:hypothetical protein